MSYAQAGMLNRWGLGPLARRLIVLLALAAIIPMTVSLTVAVMSFTSKHSNQIVKRQEEVAKRTALTISNLLETTKGQLIMIANAGDFGSHEGRRAVSIALFKANEGIDGVSIVGGDGYELLHSDRYKVIAKAELQNVSRSEYYRVTRSGKTHIGPVTFSKLNEPVIQMAVPLRDRGHNVSGALSARFNLKLMWDVLAQTEVGDMGYSYVIDSGGRLIGHQDPSLVLGGFDTSGVRSVRHVLETDGIHGPGHDPMEGLLGQEVLLSHSPAGEAGWIALVETPTQEAFATTRASVVRAIVVAALTLLGACIFAVVMGRRFVKPIHDLTESARQISTDDLSPQIAVGGN